MRDETAGHRHNRLQQLMHEELESLSRDEVTDPRLQDVHCTLVELSVDYRSARVHFVTAPDHESAADIAKVEKAFVRATTFLQGRLAEALDLKRTPALRFVYDRDGAAR